MKGTVRIEFDYEVPARKGETEKMTQVRVENALNDELRQNYKHGKVMLVLDDKRVVYCQGVGIVDKP